MRIIEGTFENSEGQVSQVDSATGRVTVLINIFRRVTPVDLDRYKSNGCQIEARPVG